MNINSNKRFKKNNFKTVVIQTKFLNAVLGILLFFSQITIISAQTTVKKIDSTWILQVDGKPFDIKGATFGYDHDVENYDAYFKELQFLGVNSIRTWATGEYTPQLLDAAEKHNIKVMVGIWMRHGRAGMEDDDTFDYLKDKEGMEDMYNNAIATVESYKNHPAVLTWGVGNEVYLNTPTDPEKEVYSKFLERVCSKIKELDPNHPITSVEAWTFGMDWWKKYVPSIDIYGLNSYGAGVQFLEDELKKREIDKPYIITEYGVTGEWDMEKDKNGITLEPSDEDKYKSIATDYQPYINSKAYNLGTYIFHYSNSDEFMGPWLCTHYRGLKRPQFWAIREAYTGEKSINHVPKISDVQISSHTFKTGDWVPISFKASDVENEPINIRFYYNQREGSRNLKNQITILDAEKVGKDNYRIQVPIVDTPIKIYINAEDTYGNVGIATTSLTIDNGLNRQQPYLVPKAKFPFYVYKDGSDMPYFPTAYMGGMKHINVNLKNKEDTRDGSEVFELKYESDEGWYGLGLVNPINNWGDVQGGYDLRGAKTFSFWAKATKDGLKAEIGFGLIGKDKDYPDTAKVTKEIKLSTKWKKFTFKLKKEDLSCIRSGLVIFSTGHWSYGSTHSIFFDDVVFE